MADDKLNWDGVVESFAHDVFFVRVSETMVIKCSISGKLRMNGIKLAIGDQVKAETSAYDPCNGRIIYRTKV